MIQNKEIIEKVLKENSQDIAFEPIPDESQSPLAQPVVEKTERIAGAAAAKTQTKVNEAPGEKTGQSKPIEEGATQSNPKKEPMDAPEQEIDADQEDKTGTSADSEGPEFSIPIAHASMMADTVLGVVNNTILEVGAGYFVTISKHKDFYDFEELIQVIEEQNVKNIKRMKLDEEDKAMLRPLLIHILRKKSKILSPEQQLLGVALSIIIKKAKIVMEIRAENELLVDRIRDIIIKETRRNRNEEEEEKEDEENEQEATVSNGQEKKKESGHEEVVYEEVVNKVSKNNTGLPDSILEVAH